MIRAVAAVTPAITASKAPQPIYASSHAAGEVAHIAPNVPSIVKQPLMRGMRSFGNHDTIALSPAINAPATPKPINARPITRAPQIGHSLQTMSRRRLRRGVVRFALGEAQNGVNGWSEDPERERNQSVDLARRALRTSGEDPYVLSEVAFVIGYFEQDIDPAIVLIDRSLEL